MSDRRSRSESLSTAPVGTKLAAFASIGKPAEKPALTHIQSKWKPLATSATIGNYARHHWASPPPPPRPTLAAATLASSITPAVSTATLTTSTLTAASVAPSPSPPPPSPHLYLRLLYPRHHCLLHRRRRAFDKNAAGLPAARSVTDLP